MGTGRLRDRPGGVGGLQDGTAKPPERRTWSSPGSCWGTSAGSPSLRASWWLREEKRRRAQRRPPAPRPPLATPGDTPRLFLCLKGREVPSLGRIFCREEEQAGAGPGGPPQVAAAGGGPNIGWCCPSWEELGGGWVVGGWWWVGWWVVGGRVGGGWESGWVGGGGWRPAGFAPQRWPGEPSHQREAPPRGDAGASSHRGGGFKPVFPPDWCPVEVRWGGNWRDQGTGVTGELV